MFARIGASLAAACKAALRGAPTVIRDLAGVAAIGSISYGAWLIMPAAGFIVGGCLVLLAVIAASLGASN